MCLVPGGVLVFKGVAPTHTQKWGITMKYLDMQKNLGDFHPYAPDYQIRSMRGYRTRYGQMEARQRVALVLAVSAMDVRGSWIGLEASPRTMMEGAARTTIKSHMG